MDESPDSEPGSLRFLRILVTTLTVVMIVGFLVLIGFLVTRFPTGSGNGAALDLPETIVLPDGTRPVAFTAAPDWFAVTTTDAILIYGRDGTLRQTVPITRE